MKKGEGRSREYGRLSKSGQHGKEGAWHFEIGGGLTPSVKRGGDFFHGSRLSLGGRKKNKNLLFLGSSEERGVRFVLP